MMSRDIGRINITFGWCWLFIGLYAFEPGCRPGNKDLVLINHNGLVNPGF